jgi:CRP/FNR family cyclic AMP-dependent transcriptional regulator
MSNACLCAQMAGPGAVLHPHCFGQVWLFEGVPSEAMTDLARRFVRKSLSAGQEIFRQGDRADSMYLIKMGAVKLWKVTEEGRILTLDIRRAGEWLGENVLLEEGKYPVGATCLERTLLCGIDRKPFESLVLDYPAVGLAVIRNLSRRIQYLSPSPTSTTASTRCWSTSRVKPAPALPAAGPSPSPLPTRRSASSSVPIASA